MAKGSEPEREPKFFIRLLPIGTGLLIAEGSLKTQAHGGLGSVVAKGWGSKAKQMARLHFVDGREARIWVANNPGIGGQRMRPQRMTWFLLPLEAFAKFLDCNE